MSGSGSSVCHDLLFSCPLKYTSGTDSLGNVLSGRLWRWRDDMASWLAMVTATEWLLGRSLCEMILPFTTLKRKIESRLDVPRWILPFYSLLGRSMVPMIRTLSFSQLGQRMTTEWEIIICPGIDTYFCLPMNVCMLYRSDPKCVHSWMVVYLQPE